MQFFAFDEAYLRRLRSGDALTESHFVSYFGELLQIKLRARRLSPDTVQELRQETFARVLAALRSEQGVRHPERLGAFVNSVCNNVLREFHRAAARFKTVNGDPPEVPDKVLDAEGLVVTAETRKLARDVLGQLSRKDARLLRAIFFEEKERGAVCQEFEVDANYLRVLLHRAKERFKAVYLESQAVAHQKVAGKGGS